MATIMRIAVALLSAAVASASDADEQEATPIRRALIMLNGMSQKVDQHIKEEDASFDKQMCFCKSKGHELQQSIAEAQEKLPQLTSSVQEAQSTVRQLESDVKEHKASRDAAQKAVQEQMALRKSEAQAYAKASTETKANIGSIQRAIAALKKGGKSALLQGQADSVRSFAQDVNPDRLREEDREKLASLLEQMEQIEDGGEEGTADVGEIVGVLSQMLDNMKSDLKQMTKQEKDSIAQVAALNVAKQKELSTLGATIDAKQDRWSATRVEMVQLKKELESTRAGLGTDRKMKENLDAECEQRKKEHATVKTDLIEEQKAIAEAADILSSDQAMNTFSKAAVTSSPGAAAASFLQVGMSDDDDEDSEKAAAQVSDMLTKLSASRADGDSFSLLATQAARTAASKGRGRAGGKRSPAGLAKISKLVNNMLQLLGKEQEDDDLKKQMCAFELKQQSATLKSLGEAIEARVADLASVKNQHDVVLKDMQTLKASIEALDKSVAEETRQRKEAHAALVKRLAENHAALELLHTAKKRLQRVYRSFIQQPLAVVDSSDEQPQQQPSDNDFGFDDVVEDQGITVHHDQGSLAQTTVERPKMMNDGTKVVNLLSTIEADINRENADLKANGKKDQAAYERMMAASAAKREADAKALSQRAATAAELAESAQILSKKRKALRGELDQTKKVVENLHQECDWLMAHYDKRKNLRSAEGEALKRTQAILAGAKISLVQTHEVRAVRHG